MLRPPPSFTVTDTPLPDTALVGAGTRRAAALDRERRGRRRDWRRTLATVGAVRLRQRIAPAPRAGCRPCARQPSGEQCRVREVRRRGRLCGADARSEEHTSELQSLMRISYAVFCLKKKKIKHNK